jgi:hypothetical protein
LSTYLSPLYAAQLFDTGDCGTSPFPGPRRYGYEHPSSKNAMDYPFDDANLLESIKDPLGRLFGDF